MTFRYGSSSWGPRPTAAVIKVAGDGGCLKDSVPTEVQGQVFGADSVEAAHPLSTASLIGSDIVDVELRRRSEAPFGPYEIRAPSSSPPLSVLFREDSAMTPIAEPALDIPRRRLA